MHAILTPVGSAGDVNPFIVLGRELRRRGHHVTLIAAEPFARVVSNAGLEFVPLGTVDEYEATTRSPDLWHPRRGPGVVFRSVTSHLRDGYAAIEQVYRPNETVLVGHVLAFFTRVFEEVHRVPAATVHLAPSIFRSDFQEPALPSGGDMSSWPRWVRHALWWGVDRLAIDPLIAPALNRWRAELGLPPVSRVFKSWVHSPQRVLALFPDWFAEPQPDWPKQVRVTGFALSDESSAPESGTDDVVGSGEPPIVFTPGSANRHAAAFFQVAIEAAARLRRRALLVTGYRDQLPPSLPGHVSYARYAPFATLFPRAAAVVHHGGIGTCAQGLAAGVPQLVMPMGFDQPDNAARLVRLGVGEMIPPARFKAAAVAAALDRLLSSADVAAACQRLGQKIDAADSVSRACDLIEMQYRQYANSSTTSSSPGAGNS